MSFEESIAEGKRLLEEGDAPSNLKRGWERWVRFCAASGVDPLDASWEDVVACLDAREMTKAWVREIRGGVRLVYRARGMASPSDDRRVAARAGNRLVYVDMESYPEVVRELLQRHQRQYIGWCQHHGKDALHGGGEQVAAFLRSLMEDMAFGQMRLANTAVSFYLVAMGRPSTEHHPVVLAFLEECREKSGDWKRGAVGAAPSLNEKFKEELYLRQWETWLKERDIRFSNATGADALEWLRGLEGLLKAAERVSVLSRSYEGADNPFAREEVVQWAREHRRRVRSGEIASPVRVSRKEQVKDEWTAARRQRAVAELVVPVGLTLEEVVGVRSDGGRRLSPSTEDVYANEWACFSDWRKERGVPLGDVVDVHVRVYLQESEHLSVAGLYKRRDSLVYGFSEHGFVVNPARSGLVSDYLRDLSLERKEAPGQQAPVREAEFRLMEDRGFSPARGPRSLRTELHWALVVALVRVMYDGMLRGSEASQARWQDLSRFADGSGSLLIASSKTDPFGKGEEMYVSATAWKYLDLLRDVRRLLGVQDRDTERIFGVSSPHMHDWIVDACADAGLVGPYGTHSMRIGAAQDLARAGFGLSMIMQAGRWMMPNMPKLYIRNITVAEGAMAEMQRMLLSGRLKPDGEAKGYDILAAYHAAQWGR